MTVPVTGVQTCALPICQHQGSLTPDILRIYGDFALQKQLQNTEASAYDGYHQGGHAIFVYDVQITSFFDQFRKSCNIA
jgi:hypothetical protein